MINWNNSVEFCKELNAKYRFLQHGGGVGVAMLKYKLIIRTNITKILLNVGCISTIYMHTFCKTSKFCNRNFVCCNRCSKNGQVKKKKKKRRKNREGLTAQNSYTFSSTICHFTLPYHNPIIRPSGCIFYTLHAFCVYK